MFDEQADQIFAITDDIAERVRKVGGTTLRSIGHIAPAAAHPRQRRRLCRSARHARRARATTTRTLVTSLREAHDLCDEENDVATASLIEVWIDEAERRVWFLFEASRRGDPGH